MHVYLNECVIVDRSVDKNIGWSWHMLIYVVL